MINLDMQEFEEQANQFIRLSIAVCETAVANCAKSPPPRKVALCAAARLLQETLKSFISLAKSI